MKQIIISGIVLLLVSSCASKRLVYIQEEIDSLKYGQEYEQQKQEYQLKTADVLDLNFTTSNEEIEDVFKGSQRDNISFNQGQRGGGGGGFYFTGFSIDNQGFIEVPVLGRFHVSGLTVPQAQERIQSRLDEFFKGAEVTVKLVSFKVTFFGEVGSQGPMFFYQDQLNIIEGLSVAGGVTNYADLREILIIRRTETGRKTMKVDLTDRDILASNDFFLMPNDMVYVKPIPTRNLRIDVADYFFYISTLTSTLSTLFLILNYTNNN